MENFRFAFLHLARCLLRGRINTIRVCVRPGRSAILLIAFIMLLFAFIITAKRLLKCLSKPLPVMILCFVLPRTTLCARAIALSGTAELILLSPRGWSQP